MDSDAVTAESSWTRSATAAMAATTADFAAANSRRWSAFSLAVDVGSSPVAVVAAAKGALSLKG